MRRLKEYDTSDVLLRRGSNGKIIAWTARIKYLLAENAYENKFEQEELRD